MFHFLRKLKVDFLKEVYSDLQIILSISLFPHPVTRLKTLTSPIAFETIKEVKLRISSTFCHTESCKPIFIKFQLSISNQEKTLIKNKFVLEQKKSNKKINLKKQDSHSLKKTNKNRFHCNKIDYIILKNFSKILIQ